MSATGSESAATLRRDLQRPRRSPASGFSLLEMLCVVLLIGVMATMTAVSVQRGLGGARAQSAAGELAAALRRARLQAVVGGRITDFRLDPARASYRIGDAVPVVLSGDLHLGMRYAREAVEPAATEAGGIRFFPDGSSSGGRITLRQGRRQWRLDVSWLTGAVAISTATVEP